MSLTVGSAFLQIVPSFAGFSDAIDAEAEKAGVEAQAAFDQGFNSGTGPKLKILADTAEANVDLDKTALKADALGAKRETIKVSTDADSATTGLKGLETEASKTEKTIGGLGDSTTGLGTKFRKTKDDVDILKGGLVNVDDGTRHFISGMSAADDANRAFSQGMKDANQGLLQVGIGLRAAEGDGVAMSQIIGNVGTSASSSAGGTNQLGGSLGSLGSSSVGAYAGIGLLATALIPIAGVATGAGIALVGMAAAGLAGIGGFALAAAGSLGGFTSTLKSEVADWQASFHGLVQPVVNDITGLIAPALNSLSPIVASATAAISSAVSSIGSGLHSSGFADFIGFLAGQAPNAIATFTVALENMGRGFASILEAFSPFISTIELGIVNLSGKFADLGNSSGLQTFVGYVQREGPVVGAFFEAIIPTVFKLVAAFAPLGDAVLRILTPILTDFGNMAPIIGLVTGAMDVFARILQAMLTPLEAVSKFIGGLANDVGGLLGHIGSWVGLNNQAADSTKSLTDALTKAGLSTKDAQRDIDLFGTTAISRMGASNFAAEQFANQLALTQDQYKALTTASGESGAKLVSDLNKSAKAAGTTGSALANMASDSDVRFNILATDIQKATAATSSSFASATSVVAAFSGQVGTTGDDVNLFYLGAVQGAQGFANNIQAAIKEGYNPALIEQILQAGPKQAGDLLGALVQNGSQAYVAQINSAQQTLSSIGQQAIEESRVVTEAIHKNNAAAAADSSAAIALDQAKFAVAAGEPVAQALAALSQAYPNYAAAAAEYGITIPRAFRDAVGPTADAANAMVSQAPAALASHAPVIAALSYNAAQFLPTALSGQIGTTISNALAQAVGVSSGILAGQPAATGAASSLASGVVRNMTLPSFFGVGQSAAQSIADGINSGAGAVSSAAQGIVNSIGAIFGHAPTAPSVGAPPKTAIGGIFTTPQVRLFAEAGPEAVLPLNNPGRMAQILSQIPNLPVLSASPNLSGFQQSATASNTARTGPAVDMHDFVIQSPVDLDAVSRKMAFAALPI